MSNCIFCKIIKGEIPGVKIYEDDRILAFLDISQATKGHTLVIPKEHVENVFEVKEDTIAYLFSKVPQLAKAITSVFNAEGLNILNNNGKVAGQSVFHFHVHLIPRYGNEDGYQPVLVNHMNDYTKEDLVKIAEQIKAKL